MAARSYSGGALMNIASPGATMAVDWEQRVDFERLRRTRLERTKAQLAASEIGALLLFDPNNLRYVTSTAIGTWERDKNIRFALVFREDDPILWDFGSAARHHKLYCPWLPEWSWRAWVLRPGVKENDVVAAAMRLLFELGSEHVEAINAISGDRCNPHPHTFSDRLIRPGDQDLVDGHLVRETVELT